MVILVPLPRVSPLGSLAIEKELAAEDSQMYWSSSSALEVTVTLLAAKKAE
jgi:hypothetical protein